MRMNGKLQDGRNDDEDTGLSDNDDEVDLENIHDDVELRNAIFEEEDKLLWSICLIRWSP